MRVALLALALAAAGCARRPAPEPASPPLDDPRPGISPLPAAPEPAPAGAQVVAVKTVEVDRGPRPDARTAALYQRVEPCRLRAQAAWPAMRNSLGEQLLEGDTLWVTARLVGVEQVHVRVERILPGHVRGVITGRDTLVATGPLRHALVGNQLYVNDPDVVDWSYVRGGGPRRGGWMARHLAALRAGADTSGICR